MTNLTTLIKKEFLEINRSKKLVILIFILLFTAISSAIFAKLMPEILKNVEMPNGFEIKIPDPTWKDAIDQFIKNISQIVLIVVVLVFAGSVAEEKNKKTLEIVLSKPISRSRFILAKFLSSALVLSVVYIVCSVIFYFYTVSLFGGFDAGNFFYLALFTLIFILLILSITIFTSTISGSQIVAAGLSFIIEVMIMAVLPYVSAIKNFLPAYTINHYKDLMDGGNVHQILPSIITSLVLILIFLLISIFSFNHQEIER